MSIVTTERVSEETYRRLALDERNGKLELYQGQLREKPGKSVEHGDIMFHLGRYLQSSGQAQATQRPLHWNTQQ